MSLVGLFYWHTILDRQFHFFDLCMTQNHHTLPDCANIGSWPNQNKAKTFICTVYSLKRYLNVHFNFKWWWIRNICIAQKFVSRFQTRCSVRLLYIFLIDSQNLDLINELSAIVIYCAEFKYFSVCNKSI